MFLFSKPVRLAVGALQSAPDDSGASRDAEGTANECYPWLSVKSEVDPSTPSESNQDADGKL